MIVVEVGFRDLIKSSWKSYRIMSSLSFVLMKKTLKDLKKLGGGEKVFGNIVAHKACALE